MCRARLLDPETKREYYANKDTGATRWTMPDGLVSTSAPVPAIPPVPEISPVPPVLSIPHAPISPVPVPTLTPASVTGSIHLSMNHWSQMVWFCGCYFLVMFWFFEKLHKVCSKHNCCTGNDAHAENAVPNARRTENTDCCPIVKRRDSFSSKIRR